MVPVSLLIVLGLFVVLAVLASFAGADTRFPDGARPDRPRSGERYRRSRRTATRATARREQFRRTS